MCVHRLCVGLLLPLGACLVGSPVVAAPEQLTEVTMASILGHAYWVPGKVCLEQEAHPAYCSDDPCKTYVDDPCGQGNDGLFFKRKFTQYAQCEDDPAHDCYYTNKASQSYACARYYMGQNLVQCQLNNAVVQCRVWSGGCTQSRVHVQ